MEPGIEPAILEERGPISLATHVTSDVSEVNNSWGFQTLLCGFAIATLGVWLLIAGIIDSSLWFAIGAVLLIVVFMLPIIVLPCLSCVRKRRCWLEVSAPVHFRLSHTSLEVTTRYGWRTQCWDASSVETVNVYKRVDTYGRCPWSLSRGQPEPILEEDNLRLVEACPAAFCINPKTMYVSVFLGARVRNQPTIVPLSRRYRDQDGLAYIFRLDRDVQLFLADRLPVGWQRFYGPTLLGQSQPHPSLVGPTMAASERAIAKLRTQAWEGAEGQACAICCIDLEAGDMVRRLHCGHSFHAECIDQWLRMHWNCPTCRRTVRLQIVGVETTPPSAGTLEL